MAEYERAEPVVGTTSPFTPAPTEGLPYEKGSAEEEAVERVLKRARDRRADEGESSA